MSTFRIKVEEQMVNGELHFFSSFERDGKPVTLTAEEMKVVPSVNLSRGRVKMYSLNNLSDHNGSGAHWDDGRELIHSASALESYRARVSADIANAWKSFKKSVAAAAFNTPKKTFFTSNGP